MARPKSEERRQAIIDSAIRLIARDGLGASTANIAREAGVPNGSIFQYFPTKSELVNEVYLEIKKEAISAVDEGLSEAGDERAQLLHLWTRWTHWGAANPDKRRALTQLSASTDVLDETRAEAFAAAELSVSLVRRVSRRGALKDQGPAVIGGIFEALANTTMDLMAHDPANAQGICRATFEAVWNALR